MATQAQIVANRQNAQKSTGPRTAEGKATVSLNAVKHGLFAVQDVTIAENQADFDLLRDEMLAELAPVGVMESMLAARIVSLSWRLKRAERMQNEVIEYMVDSHAESLRRTWGSSPKDPRNSGDYLPLGRIAAKDWSNSRVIEHLLIYERRIEQSLYKTMAELRELRLMRKLEAANAEEQAAAKPCSAQDHNTDSAKQSQSVRAKFFSEELPDKFAPAHEGATACVTEDYDNKPSRGLQENEPKQSQFQDLPCPKARRTYATLGSADCAEAPAKAASNAT